MSKSIASKTYKYPYMVYENDLKFKHLRNIDSNRAIWDNDVKHKYHNDNLDSLEHRLLECKKNNFSYLDLSHMNLTTLPDLSKLSIWNDLKNIKFLFINDNKISSYDSKFSCFDKLESLDISNNLLKSITYLPLSLKELTCNNNKLTSIPNSDNLHRLDCSMNEISEIPPYKNIYDIICNNNNIKYIQSYATAKRIVCNDNPLKKIEKQNLMTYFDCENTNLEGKLDMKNLKHLICNNTKINTIENLKNLQTLEMYYCDITKIPYISTLKEIFFNPSQNVLISSLYKVAKKVTENETVYIKIK